ncbi:hypothetical protein TrRE_jg2094, partial [Triparma retinervis]
PELKDFNFQRIFLKPFVVIMESPNSREDVRELILRCVDNMIRALAKNIRSGWRTIFSILMLSASDSSVVIAKLGLEILHRLLDSCLPQLCTVVEDFLALVKTSLSFVYGYSAAVLPPGLQMRALCYVACCADAVASGLVHGGIEGGPGVHGYAGLGGEGGGERGVQMCIWKAIIDGLSEGAHEARGGRGGLAQRGCACALRAVLLRHGNLFSAKEWRCIVEQSVRPALVRGIRRDGSGVGGLFSRSPLGGELDLVREAPGKVPGEEDERFKRISMQAQSEGSSCARVMGKAEGLVEAMLWDLRRGGDGSLVE